VVPSLDISTDGAGNPQVADLTVGDGFTRNDGRGVVDPLLGGVGWEWRRWWRVEVCWQGVAYSGCEAGREASVDHSTISQTRAPVIVRITFVILLRLIQSLSQWGLKYDKMDV